MNKMNTLLVAINAKYIHSNLAVRYIQKYGASLGHIYSIGEFTINQPYELILSEIYKLKPQILGFSCYIWNIGLIRRLISDIKKLLSDTVIVLGGPEIAGTSFEGCDYIIRGAGERAFYELVTAIETGAAYAGEHAFDFSQTVFPYDDCDFDQLGSRIIYYEAQRGCPFKCGYCLSGAEDNIQLLPLDRVFNELSVFLRKRVKQVKLVDRTFNCSKSFRRNIWEHLIKNDNGVTNFHFEITPELLDAEDFKLLKEAREALFQFEIGIQSANRKTLEAIERNADFAKISENVLKLRAMGNIHLHLDLIAGLPFESFEGFRKSFNYVFSLKPHMLQLGFLKLLKGSRLRAQAETYGIAYREEAPYEVLYTKDISFDELLALKNTEHMLESYYNSGLALKTIEYSIGFFPSPFDFFYSMGQFWEQKRYHHIQHSKMQMFERLLEFLASTNYCNGRLEAAKEAIIYDILVNDNIKSFPESLSKPVTKEQQDFVDELLSDKERIGAVDSRLPTLNKKQLRKQCNIIFFKYAVDADFAKRDNAVFFHYTSPNGRGTAFELK